MTTGMEDSLLAVAGTLFVIVIIAAQRKSRNIYGKLWAPLIPLVRGRAQDSRLTGTFQNMPVLARISGDQDTETPHFFYELTLTPGPSPADWSLSFTGEKFLGTGTKTWRIKSKDDALRQRLTDTGAAAVMHQWPTQPEITFKSKTGALHYWESADSQYALPSAQQFQAQLDLLANLAALNRQANSPQPQV